MNKIIRQLESLLDVLRFLSNTELNQDLQMLVVDIQQTVILLKERLEEDGNCAEAFPDWHIQALFKRFTVQTGVQMVPKASSLPATDMQYEKHQDAKQDQEKLNKMAVKLSIS